MTRLAASLLFPALAASITMMDLDLSFGADSNSGIPVLFAVTAKAFHHASHGDKDSEKTPKDTACHRARSKARKKAVEACENVGGTPLRGDVQVSGRGFQVPPFFANCTEPPHPMSRAYNAYYDGHGYCWASASLICEVPTSWISEIDPRFARWTPCEVLTNE